MQDAKEMFCIYMKKYYLCKREKKIKIYYFLEYFEFRAKTLILKENVLLSNLIQIFIYYL